MGRVTASSRRVSSLDGRPYLFSAVRQYRGGRPVVIRFGTPVGPMSAAAGRVARGVALGVLMRGNRRSMRPLPMDPHDHGLAARHPGTSRSHRCRRDRWRPGEAVPFQRAGARGIGGEPDQGGAEGAARQSVPGTGRAHPADGRGRRGDDGADQRRAHPAHQSRRAGAVGTGGSAPVLAGRVDCAGSRPERPSRGLRGSPRRPPGGHGRRPRTGGSHQAGHRGRRGGSPWWTSRRSGAWRRCDPTSSPMRPTNSRRR